jgi:hypothetical protein
VTDYASKLTTTAAAVLDGEQFVAAMKCFPQGYGRRKIKHSSLGGMAGAVKVASERTTDHALDGELLPMELAIGLTETRGFVFRLSTITGKAKLPPLRVVPRDAVVAVASQPGRTYHMKQTLIWLALRDGGALALETAQYHQRNGEQFVEQLLRTARTMDVPVAS